MNFSWYVNFIGSAGKKNMYVTQIPFSPFLRSLLCILCNDFVYGAANWIVYQVNMQFLLKFCRPKYHYHPISENMTDKWLKHCLVILWFHPKEKSIELLLQKWTRHNDIKTVNWMGLQWEHSTGMGKFQNWWNALKNRFPCFNWLIGQEIDEFNDKIATSS